MRKNFIFRSVLFVTGGLISILITITTIFFAYSSAMSGFEYGKGLGYTLTEEKPYVEVEISLPADTSLDKLADILKDSGVIDNTAIFIVDCKLKGVDENFPPGKYTVNTTMSTKELIAALSAKENVSSDIRITILEGYSISNIVSYLEDKEIVLGEEFIEASDSGNFEYSFIADIPKRENHLEGYLFPDTYFISPDADSYNIINKMLTRFNEIYGADYRQQADNLGFKMDEIITIASIIEKEVHMGEDVERTNRERAKMSAVIHNRLKQGMKLEMSSTVIYVVDKRKDSLTDQDYKVDSPYNTFTHEGLPYGPICNPGKACIEAALNPEESDLLYFLANDKETTGELIFTNNIEDYEEAKKLYGQQ